ncbi:protein-tyrosine phosphatase family protein [Roseivivax isoporae]|uniref:Protein phosphatase n=1 Tax=Roseivivax isoporae LMG 25204 TaxID=1449351 RepID=X7FAW0_9RHOB|nr:dual specificity protein phosphatase family protein [Roseivivax isoporae]ETX29863.1 protein phosphatase [Roseivivax isoporae LMG 25204]
MTVIHALPVGGGILALAPLPGASGDYRGDLGHVLNWTPAVVVSLTTEVEMLAVGAQALGAQLQERATRWVHLPVADMGVPDDAFMARWPEVSAFARRALMGGGRVLVHCHAGRGRSGMVALRLMIEAGEAPDEALERLRGVVPGAVETAAQMDWANRADRGAARFVRARTS